MYEGYYVGLRNALICIGTCQSKDTHRAQCNKITAELLHPHNGSVSCDGTLCQRHKCISVKPVLDLQQRFILQLYLVLTIGHVGSYYNRTYIRQRANNSYTSFQLTSVSTFPPPHVAMVTNSHLVILTVINCTDIGQGMWTIHSTLLWACWGLVHRPLLHSR